MISGSKAIKNEGRRNRGRREKEQRKNLLDFLSPLCYRIKINEYLNRAASKLESGTDIYNISRIFALKKQGILSRKTTYSLLPWTIERRNSIDRNP